MPLEIPRIALKDCSLGFMFVRLSPVRKWFVFINTGHTVFIQGICGTYKVITLSFCSACPDTANAAPGPNGRKIHNMSHGFLNDLPPTTPFFSIYLCCLCALDLNRHPPITKCFLQWAFECLKYIGQIHTNLVIMAKISLVPFHSLVPRE